MTSIKKTKIPLEKQQNCFQVGFFIFALLKHKNPLLTSTFFVCGHFDFAQ